MKKRRKLIGINCHRMYGSSAEARLAAVTQSLNQLAEEIHTERLDLIAKHLLDQIYLKDLLSSILPVPIHMVFSEDPERSSTDGSNPN